MRSGNKLQEERHPLASTSTASGEWRARVLPSREPGTRQCAWGSGSAGASRRTRRLRHRHVCGPIFVAPCSSRAFFRIVRPAQLVGSLLKQGATKTRRGAAGSNGIRVLVFLILLCGLLPLPVHAFQVQSELEPTALRIGEAANMTITVTGLENPPPPDLPDISGLRISGPGVERSFSFTMRNGVQEQSRAVTFRYRIIPLEPGNFKIGPFTYTAKGQSAEIPERELRVVMPGAPREAEDPAQQERDALPDLMFAELQVSRAPVFVQEWFEITLSVYTRGLNLGRDIYLENMPETGLSMQPFQELRAAREIVGNDVYEVRRYRARARALRSGTIVFEPTVRLHVLVERDRRERRDPFGDFFGPLFSNVERHPFDLQPEPVELAVRPLPTEGRPESFTGAVGQFAFRAEVSPKEITAGDPITLRMRVAGQGNIDVVRVPSLEEQEQVRAYDVRVASREVNRDLTSGEKTFEQIVIPRSEEVSELPALQFAFFEPETETYRTITEGPFPLTVRPADPRDSRVVFGDADPERARMLGADIAYLKPPPRAWRSIMDPPWFLHPAVWGAQLIPPLALLAFLMIGRHKRALVHDPARMRRRRAPRSARTGLRNAESALRKRDRQAFYEALWQAISSYFGNRLNLPPGDIEAPMIVRALERGGMNEDDLNRLQRLFEICDRQRFGLTSPTDAPVTDDHIRNWSEFMNDLNRLLKQCERIQI